MAHHSFLVLAVSLFYISTAQECPDGVCLSDQTCCDMGSQAYACCPYKNATCCSDQTHCCPHNYACDLSLGCVREELLRSSESKHPRFLPLTETIPVKSKLTDCPSGTCLPTETCCDVGSGQYGCCPYASANCCTDGQHCCPNGYTCDLNTGQCVKSATYEIIPATEIPVILRSALDCPTDTCPSGDTCCTLSGGGYGCCPYTNAVCCVDGQHCCPPNYYCDLTNGDCKPITAFPSKFSVPFLPKVPQLPVSITKMVIAKETTCTSTTCPSTETCCPISGDSYGCCPYQNAICCDDQHCCPPGYQCDRVHSSCVRLVGEYSNTTMARIATSP